MQFSGDSRIPTPSGTRDTPIFSFHVIVISIKDQQSLFSYKPGKKAAFLYSTVDETFPHLYYTGVFRAFV